MLISSQRLREGCERRYLDFLVGEVGMRLVVLAGLSLFVASCQWMPGTDASKINAAKQLVREALLDGESAKFEDVVVSKGATSPEKVCGWVNAKNRLGAYVGAEQFLVADGRVRQLGSVQDDEYSGAFGACVAGHPKASDRMMRDLERTVGAYKAAVENLQR